MGAFTPPSRTVRLVFPEGDELHGLEIEARKLNVGEVRAVAADGLIPDELFVKNVLSWNLPGEVGVDGLASFEVEDLKRVKNAWYEAAIGAVPRPLENGSTSGEPAGVDSLPMDSL
jgi:hypothetical protein